MKRRKIAVITTSRAEYGLLYWVMKAIQSDPQLELLTIVSGTHLSPEFGYSVQMIADDGFQIDEKLDILLSSDTPEAIVKSMGLATIAAADAFKRMAPDIVVLLGDRFEILAFAQAAMMMHIPVAHIHGGEVTEGALDDAIRHAITKLAYLHFPVAAAYRRRIIQMGEQPERVFNFGAPGLDHIAKTKLLSKAELAKALDIQFGPTTFLVTYHPVTVLPDPCAGIDELLMVLADYPKATVIFTQANADEGGREINKRINRFVEQHGHRCYFFKTLGLQRYLSLAKVADAVIGNSSSGLIEVPLVQTPTVNIGPREDGRLKANSVVDCMATVPAIKAAIDKALSDDMQQILTHVESPYGRGNASEKIVNVLKTVDLTGKPFKKFHDIDTGAV